MESSMFVISIILLRISEQRVAKQLFVFLRNVSNMIKPTGLSDSEVDVIFIVRIREMQK